MEKSGVSPGERILLNTANMCKERFAAKNTHGSAMRKEQIYEIRRQMKKDKNKTHGIGTNPLANMSEVQSAIKAQDLAQRQSVKDESTYCLGIVRKNDWNDGVSTWLWGQNSLVLLDEFSLADRLILYLDATKYGHYGLHKTPAGKKVLYSKLTLQPGDGFIIGDQRSMLSKQFFKGVTIAEMISNKNKAEDVCRFLTALNNDCEAYSGRQCSPLLVHTDLAGQFLTAILSTFGSEDHVTTQIMYANVTMLIYLRLSAMMEKEIKETGGWTESATWAWDMHRKYAPTACHYCGSHSYRSAAAWPQSKKREHDAPEVHKYSDQFCTIFKTFAKEAKNMDDISMAMARVSALIAVFSTKTLHCPNYTINSKTQECCNEDNLMKVAEDCAVFMESQAKTIHIHSHKHLDAKLEKEMKLNENLNQQHFKGNEVAQGMIENMQSGMLFSATILRSKDKKKKTGVIEVVIVYYPFNDDGDIEPQCVDGFTHKVRLPYRGEKWGIRNKLCSKRARDYMEKQWLKRIALYIRTTVSVIEKTQNMNLAANNQQIEGMINNEKNLVSRMKEKTSEPGLYWWYRYQNLHQGSKYMVTEMERYEGYMERRKELMKNRKLALVSKAHATEDARELEEENVADMIFDRTGATWMDGEETVRAQMEDAFILAGLNNNTKQKRFEAVLEESGKSSFMSMPTFNKWMDRKPVRQLDRSIIAIFDSFIKKHII